MLTPFKFFLFALLASALLCCSDKKDDLIIEQEIFASLLPEMVEAIYKDPEIYLNFQQALKHTKSDSLDERGVVEKDINKKIVVAISEILTSVNANDKKSMEHFIKVNNLKIRISDSKDNHKLSLPKYLNKRYTFKYFSKRTDDNTIIYTDGVNVSHISISFSRVQFDEKKEYGVFTGTYDCQPKCGIGYVIVVKKAAKNWVIYKIAETWIS